MNLKHSPGPPMTLGSMRELGVHHLITLYLQRAHLDSPLEWASLEAV